VRVIVRRGQFRMFAVRWLSRAKYYEVFTLAGGVQVNVNRKLPGPETAKQKVVPDETFGEL